MNLSSNKDFMISSSQSQLYLPPSLSYGYTTYLSKQPFIPPTNIFVLSRVWQQFDYTLSLGCSQCTQTKDTPYP